VLSPMTPAQVVTAIGRTTRDAARSEEPANEFSRGQLMSAYSASRHLGVELAQFAPVVRAFADEVAAELRFERALPSAGDGLRAIAARLVQAPDAHAIGDAVAEALDELRDDRSAAAAALRARLHAALRRLSDREVELLAEVIEGAPKS